MLINAVKSNQHEFTILCYCYDGEKYCIVQHEILPIMAELATHYCSARRSLRVDPLTSDLIRLVPTKVSSVCTERQAALDAAS